MRSALLQFKSAVKVLSVTVAVSLTMIGCGTLQGEGGQSASSGVADKINVVSASNVYANIAEAVGGDRVSARALITNQAQDPHGYEASAQDRLLVSRATVLIRNGGGYDDFLTQLAEADSGQAVIDVTEISGLRRSAEQEFNEHLWYSLPTMASLADALASEFSRQQPAEADAFRQRAQRFKDSLQELEADIATLKNEADGQSVVVTEPVPLYLLEQAGLVDRTPAEFSRAVESESDVPPLVLREVVDLITSRQVRLVAYNDQTETDQTRQLQQAAQQAGVPVVNFTETLPEGQDYLSWMRINIENLQTALR